MNATMIYWGCAILAVFAMQWAPLWVLFPFVIVAVCYQAYKNRRAKEAAKHLPDVASAEPARLEPVLPDRVDAEHSHPQTPPVANGTVFDPMVEPHGVYQSSVDWSVYEVPTFLRKKIALPEPTSPAAPVAEVPATPNLPEPAATAAEENETADGQNGGFSFIY